MTSSAFGSWKSPLTAELIARQTIGLSDVVVDGSDVYWSELRPTEGRNVIIRRDATGAITDVLPKPFSARTRVHEYGGGAFCVADGVVYFSNFADQRLYRLPPDAAPQAMMPVDGARYADAVVDKTHARLICVREQHPLLGTPINDLVAIDLHGGEARVLAAGGDFYASPRVRPDGAELAWLCWNHPNMPWDGTRLCAAPIRADGSLGVIATIAGGAEEAIFQPEYAPDGRLYFISDRSGWWNMYRHGRGWAEPVVARAAEFGVAQWLFGLSTYAFPAADRVVCAYQDDGAWRLGVADFATHTLTAIDTPYTEFSYLRAADTRTVAVAAAPTKLPEIVEYDHDTRRMNVIHASAGVCLEPGYISKPRAISYPTGDSATAHAFFYPPRNHDYEDTPGVPPLLVLAHGGPTSAALGVLNLKTQFWTSRGFAVLEVNYRGSTGYGRSYRHSLRGRWGVADVEDCVAGARYVVAQGWADGARTAIRGASAGGFTALCALAFHNVFQAGASYYGVSDLERLAADTHKFEAHYLDRLIGPYPQARELYRARSPLHHAARISAPVIFFQGLDDPVVPPDQTESMVAALRSRGVAVSYVAFEGESHGFRRADSIRRALAAELSFYQNVFGLEREAEKSD